MMRFCIGTRYFRTDDHDFIPTLCGAYSSIASVVWDTTSNLLGLDAEVSAARCLVFLVHGAIGVGYTRFQIGSKLSIVELRIKVYMSKVIQAPVYSCILQDNMFIHSS